MSIHWGIIAGLLAFVSSTALAEVGRVKTIDGAVYVERDGVRRSAALGDRLEQSDVVITGPDGRVGITFVDNSRFSAGPDTTIELARFRFDPTTHEGEFLTRVKRGSVSIISGQMAKHSSEAMRVETPTVMLGVRGTEFLVKVEE